MSIQDCNPFKIDFSNGPFGNEVPLIPLRSQASTGPESSQKTLDELIGEEEALHRELGDLRRRWRTFAVSCLQAHRDSRLTIKQLRRLFDRGSPMAMVPWIHTILFVGIDKPAEESVVNSMPSLDTPALTYWELIMRHQQLMESHACEEDFEAIYEKRRRSLHEGWINDSQSMEIVEHFKACKQIRQSAQ